MMMTDDEVVRTASFGVHVTPRAVLVRSHVDVQNEGP